MPLPMLDLLSSAGAESPAPQGRSPLDLIAPFLALGTALSGNQPAATGAFEGLAHNELQRRHQEEVASQDASRNRQFSLQEHAQSLREQEFAQQEQLRQQAADDKRKRDLMSEAEKIRTMKFRDQADYDAYVRFAEQGMGVRPNTLRAVAPYRSPSAKDNALAAVEAMVKTHGPDVLLTGAKVMVDLNNDGVPDSVDIMEAARIGDYPVLMDPVTGKPMKSPKGVSNANVQPFDEVFKGLVSEFGAQKGRPPTDAEKGDLAVKAQRSLDKPPAGSDGSDPLKAYQRFTAGEKLADKWTKATAPVKEMERQFSLMQTGLRRFKQGDTNGGAQAVLVTFQKILDPTSVVRESEYARSASGLSLMNRLEGYVERLKSGGAGVPAAELAGMVETARQFLDSMQNVRAGTRKRIGASAKEFGIDPMLVFDDEGAAPAPAPAVGDQPAPISRASNVGDYALLPDGRIVVITEKTRTGFKYDVVK